MKLIAGERFTLQREDCFLQVVSGSLEVYAVTRARESFRQEMLMMLTAGEAAFPAFDEFEGLDISVYALEETELEEIPLAASSPEVLRPLMILWFRRMLELPRFRRLADKGDDVLKTWASGQELAEAGDLPSLLATFRRHEGIFSMLQGVGYQAEKPSGTPQASEGAAAGCFYRGASE